MKIMDVNKREEGDRAFWRRRIRSKVKKIL